MQTETYIDYLKTDHWHQLRRFVLERDRYTCQRCGASNRVLHVHHLVYRGWYNELASDLVTLCALCHAIEHARGVRLWVLRLWRWVRS
jgi:5-methylcytosine-specific restriction endonuclease McrA